MAKWRVVEFSDVHKLPEGELLRISENRDGKTVWGEVEGTIGKWELDSEGVYRTVMYLNLGNNKSFEHEIMLHPMYKDALYEVCIVKGLTLI